MGILLHRVLRWLSLQADIAELWLSAKFPGFMLSTSDRERRRAGMRVRSNGRGDGS
jgi:hypothetical protein